MKKLGIYIPSYKRPKRLNTIRFVTKKFINNTFIVITKDDYKDYKKNFNKKNLLVCPENGICKTRQWIIENSKTKYALILDDDLRFQVRRGKNLKLKNFGKNTFNSMVELLTSWLNEGLVHVGISQRFGNNRIEEDFKEKARMNNAYAYNCKEMIKLKEKHNVAFDYLEKKYNKQLVMEDFFVTLSLLQLGYKNRVTFKYCWNQDQSGSSGGCSEYRSAKMQKESAIILSKEFPKYVRIVEKKSAIDWKGIGDTRTDVVISWIKAFRRKDGISKFI